MPIGTIALLQDIVYIVDFRTSFFFLLRASTSNAFISSIYYKGFNRMRFDNLRVLYGRYSLYYSISSLVYFCKFHFLGK